MPRAGNKARGLNQHNTRHENGVVAPGKRIAKQKSNGHLSGSADGTSHSKTRPTSPPSAARTTTRLPDTRTNDESSDTQGGYQPAEDIEKRSSESLPEALEMPSNGMNCTNGSVEHTHRKIDVNAAKNPVVPDNSIWHLTLTILRSCPLGDTLAILIFLLSLPPTMLTVTNALFAVLTFITPTGSSSIPTSFGDIFQGSGGTPSLATIIVTDVFGLMLWLVIWAPMQTLCIELAQAVVATQLGGGNASKKKGSDRTLLCMGIVTASHMARHQWIPKRLFGYDWSAILSSIPYVSKSPTMFSTNDFIPTRSPAGWFRVLIALHILIQGLVHIARRWIQKREYSQTVSANKKMDPEAVAGSPVRPIVIASAEPSTQGVSVAPDSVPKISSASTKEARDKISSGKKKRKQGTYVRSQQPLWAAFAHTKITILREYEQSHTHSEVSGANAIDTRNLGSAPFVSEDGCVWISDVLPTSFRFNASSFTMPRSGDPSPEHPIISPSTGIDRSKPLYVRINDTDWTSTTLETIATDESADGQWAGEVFGLSPSSSYKCSFVQSEDGVVVHSVVVTTPSSLPAENGIFRPFRFQQFQTANVMPDSYLSSALPAHRPHRPSSPTSPTTTLKNSIAAFESNLSEAQARQKRSKKDNKAASASLKKDIEVFSAKISKLGGEDKAHLNRHLQWNQHTRQADEAVTFLSGEIESMGCLPEDEIRLSKERKAGWDEARTHQTATRDDLFRCKGSAHQEKSSMHAEATSTQQKKERLLARKSKLNDQHDRLESATSQGLDEWQRKNSEQAAKDVERISIENRSLDQLAHYQKCLQDSRYVTQQIWQQAQIVESAFHEQQQVMNAPDEERAITPEGDLPGTVSHHTATPSFRFPAFASPDPPNGIRSHSGSFRHSDNRPRSTSMLSGNSVYADFEDQDPAPPMPARAVEAIRERGRKQSGGSGSGSSGSQRDPASPVVGSAALMSPGKRSPVWNH
ncbi:MAG: hypothetical protein ALECFALPRED_001274 [Alectoria fallacina]|uniref:Ubiquitination network signaling protein n=1 Tax=Alectoria fallacina TaxID=1903189 RepID=A0A8H3F7T7_9LECA|nr:MAG: hypothetical protein ALECFALPRED_001274 [Alectoria fallacina]